MNSIAQGTWINEWKHWSLSMLYSLQFRLFLEKAYETKSHACDFFIICQLHSSINQLINTSQRFTLQSNFTSHLLSCKMEGCSLTVVSFINICSCLQESICTIQSVSQHTIHKWCPPKLIFFVFKGRVSYETDSDIW